MTSSTARRDRRGARVAAIACAAVGSVASFADAQSRVLGLDVSAHQGNISQTTWNNIRSVEDRRFVFIRSSRGGTTGEDHRQGGYPVGDNTFFTLSQRYDDPYFVQNITGATNAGLYAGTYHFARHDIITSTPSSNGIANTGADEANHFLQMAGPFMRPGYLPPVFDLEGPVARTNDQIAQFCIDFSNQIHLATGLRPAMYINGSYCTTLAGASSALRTQLVKVFPVLWTARYAYQSPNYNSPGVQTAHPKDTFSGFYGPWDDFGTAQPWNFWQYASTGRLQSYNNGGNNLDFNVAQGDIENVKDLLVPALWVHNSNGEWTDLANWNSGQTPFEPVIGLGQLPRVGPWVPPAVRLPGGDDSVILDRTDAAISVTLASGAHNIRRLQTHEVLYIDGGSLSVSRQAEIFSVVHVSDTGVFAPTWLTVGTGGRVNLEASGAGVLKVNTVDASDGKIDLTNNKMIVDYTGLSALGSRNGTTYSGVLGEVQAGRNGGAWNGNGILTSMSDAAGGVTTLAVAEAAEVVDFAGGQTGLWRGNIVDATSVVVMYTYAGDANLSGHVDGDDYWLIDSNFAMGPSLFGFTRGDFNYDGVIDGDDYHAIDAGYLGQGGPLSAPAGVSAVPEPAGVGALLFGAAALCGRRRRLSS